MSGLDEQDVVRKYDTKILDGHCNYCGGDLLPRDEKFIFDMDGYQCAKCGSLAIKIGDTIWQR